MNEEQLKLLKLSNALNAANQSHFNTQASNEIKVNIRPDKNMSLGVFIKDTLIEDSYRAHPTTIAAMKKDIFVAGQNLFEDLEVPYTCENCQIKLDLQFWHFCPFCEKKFPLDATHNSNVKNC